MSDRGNSPLIDVNSRNIRGGVGGVMVNDAAILGIEFLDHGDPCRR